MEVIEPMGDDLFDEVFEAGQELMQHLKETLERRGLDPDHAVNVLAAAAGGVVVGSGIGLADFIEGVMSTSRRWRRDPFDEDSLHGAVLEPRPDGTRDGGN